MPPENGTQEINSANIDPQNVIDSSFVEPENNDETLGDHIPQEVKDKIQQQAKEEEDSFENDKAVLTGALNNVEKLYEDGTIQDPGGQREQIQKLKDNIAALKSEEKATPNTQSKPTGLSSLSDESQKTSEKKVLAQKNIERLPAVNSQLGEKPKTYESSVIRKELDDIAKLSPEETNESLKNYLNYFEDNNIPIPEGLSKDPKVAVRSLQEIAQKAEDTRKENSSTNTRMASLNEIEDLKKVEERIHNTDFSQIEKNPTEMIEEPYNPIKDLDQQLNNLNNNEEDIPEPAQNTEPQRNNSEDQETIRQLQDEVAALRRTVEELRSNNGSAPELTPEQKKFALQREMKALLNGRTPNELNLEERSIYLDKLLALEGLDNQLRQKEVEELTQRERRLKKIKIIAGLAGGTIGFGLALTNPIGIAGVLAVTIGGRFTAKGLNKWAESRRALAKTLGSIDTFDMTPEQRATIEGEISRKQKWANRLETTAAVVAGGSTGFGIGYGLGSIARSWLISNYGVTGLENQPVNAPGTGAENIPTGTGGGGGVESLHGSDWFDTSKYGWNWEQYGWKGPRLSMTGTVGGPQAQFVDLLQQNGVSTDMLYGNQAGEIFQQGLRASVYQGGDLGTIAQQTAEQLIANAS